jgi:hypothetical protein
MTSRQTFFVVMASARLWPRACASTAEGDSSTLHIATHWSGISRYFQCAGLPSNSDARILIVTD